MNYLCSKREFISDSLGILFSPRWMILPRGDIGNQALASQDMPNHRHYCFRKKKFVKIVDIAEYTHNPIHKLDIRHEATD